LAVPSAQKIQKSVGRPVAGGAFLSAGRAFKEKCDGHFPNLSDLLEARGADAVRALFVFLYLLKRQPDVPAEYLL
jgi:hypothetical protein